MLLGHHGKVKPNVRPARPAAWDPSALRPSVPHRGRLEAVLPPRRRGQPCLGYQLRHPLPPLADRQLRRIADARHLGPALLEQRPGSVDGLPQPCQSLIERFAPLLPLPKAAKAPIEGPPIAQQTGVEIGLGGE